MPSKKPFLSSMVLFVLVSFLLISSVGASLELWSQTYGGPDSETAYALVETSDGGYTLAGGASLVKTDAYGNMEWNQIYGRATGERAYSLVETSDGGFALAGYTYSWDPATAGAGDYDFWLVKTDANGNMEWNQTYGGAEYDLVSSLVETVDGGYALAGYTLSFGAGSDDFWLVKTDASGNMEWNQTYGGAYQDRAHSLVEGSDGGYVLAGYTTSYGAGPYNFWLVKTDEYGIIPEFPSWIILPLFLVATVSAIVFKKKLFNQSS